MDVRVPDQHVDELHERGYTIVEGFLSPDELAAAQGALWHEFPRPAEYFEDPGRFSELARSQFAGLHHGLARSWKLNRLAFHPDLVDLAERALGSDDLHLYKIEVWAKYAGAVDYDQALHRDFGNHSLVVPKRADPVRQMTTFILLSDVTDEDGPTKVLPLEHSRDVPYWPLAQPMGAHASEEVAITGPAGSLFAYRTDILHRGSQITGERRSRFALLADYQVWGRRWDGRIAWPHHALDPAWTKVVERASPRERCLFGFPPPGDPYWDDQTIADVGTRYPGIDMTPYRLG